MREKFTVGDLTWISLNNPTKKEIRDMVEELDIKPYLAHDLSTPVPRSYTECTDKTLKITIDYPVVKRDDLKQPHEIKLLVTKTHLVTVQFGEIDAVHQFKKEFEVVSLLKNPGLKATAVHIMFSLLHYLLNGLHHKLDYLNGRINVIDEAIHVEQEREMVREISKISRRIISFRYILQTQEQILSNVHSSISKPFGTEYVDGIKELSRHHHQVIRRLRSISDMVDELRETNIGILTTKQNEIMKTLTIIAFITFPLTLFTSIFGMNTIATPIVGHVYDFWIIVGIMLIVSTGLFYYFKYKKWI